MIVLAVLALAVVSSSALPRPEAVPRRNDDLGSSKGQLEHLQDVSSVTSQGPKNQEIARRSLDSLGGGNLLRQIDGGSALSTSLIGKQRSRQLDTLGNGNLIRRTLNLEMESDDNPRTRQLDTLGGGWLLLREDPQKMLARQVDYTDDSPLFYLVKPGELDSLYDRLYNRRLTRNMNLDTLDGATFGASKRFDTLNGGAFGAQKRNMDEIDHVGFNSFVKKNFDEIDRVGFNSFVKRPMDEIDRVGFNSFVKRPMDEIDRVGFDRFVKRPMDEIDRVGFDRFVKRH